MDSDGKISDNTKTWSTIKDDIFGKKGTVRRDELEREIEAIKIGYLIREARQPKT